MTGAQFDKIYGAFKGVMLAVILFGLCYGILEKLGDDKPKEVGRERATAFILQAPGEASAKWSYWELPMTHCAWCRRTVKLNRHHIVPQVANPGLTHVRTNLIVLCRDCHFVIGHRCDWRRYNPDVVRICTEFTNSVRSVSHESPKEKPSPGRRIYW